MRSCMYLQVTFIIAAFVAASAASAQDYLVTPHAVLQLEEKGNVTSLAFSRDDNLLLAGTESGSIQCWNLERKSSIAKTQADNDVVFLAFLSGDKSYVCVDAGGNVSIYDLLKGKSDYSFRSRSKPVKVAIDAGKQYLAIATTDDKIELVDLKAQLPLGAIDARGKIDDLLFLGFDRLGQHLLAINQTGDVVSWNPATLKQIRELTLAASELHGSRSSIKAASTNRAANIFVIGLEEVALPSGGIFSGKDLMRQNMVIAYDWSSGIEVKRVKTTWCVEQIALGPGSDHIAVTNDEDKSITLIDLRKGELGSTMAMEEKPVALCVSENNTRLAAGTKDGLCTVWNIRFKGEASVKAPALPSMSGRIRTRSGTEPALKPGVPIRLAILNFEAKGVPQEYADICLNSMSNSLANFDYITLVERKQIETVVKEQQFQMSDLTDERTSVQVGKLLNADNVLIGSIGKLGTSMILTARILNVETGKVMKGREVICEECRDQDIYDAVSTLVSTIAQ